VRAFYRTAARLIADAADALEHAHTLGIVHRDVKPANLLVDDAGKLYVSDFGLARVGPDAGLTVSGDLLGTLRYMAPEQALARHGLVDHRADVYGLGCTLYELLTGRPAVDATDRAEVLRKIAFEDPKSLRKLDKAIPAELETIALKCLAKNPAERYATAGELANDLLRWLDHQTIKAKPPTLRQRAVKWARRHRPVVGAAATVVVLAAAMLVSGLTWAGRDAAARRERAEQVVTAALADADRLQAQALWPQALDAARRADGLLAGGAVGDDLRRRVDEALTGLDLVARLEDVRTGYANAVRDYVFDAEWKVGEYARAFRAARIVVDELGPEELAARIPPAVRVVAAAALDDWSGIGEDVRARGRLRAAARAADPDEWRGRVRAAVADKDRPALAALAAAARGAELPAASLVRLGTALWRAGLQAEAVELLRATQRRYPGDFWVNFELAHCLTDAHPDEAVRFNTAAVALRPGSSAAHNNLGVSLAAKGDVDGAAAAYAEAIRLAPDHARPQSNLARVLAKAKAAGRVVAAFREAARRRPADASAHTTLGIALQARGDLGGAAAAFREAARVRPGNVTVLTTLGKVLQADGDPDGAAAAFRKAAGLTSDYLSGHTMAFPATAYDNLCALLRRTGRLGGLIAEQREAVRRRPDDPAAQARLGVALLVNGDKNGAAEAYRAALRRRPDSTALLYGLQSASSTEGERLAIARELVRREPYEPRFYSRLGHALAGHDLDGAIASWRESIMLAPSWPSHYAFLAEALRRKGDRAGAEAACREALRISPTNARAHSALGALFRDRGDRDGAVRHYREADRHAEGGAGPNAAWDHGTVRSNLLWLEDWDGAIAACRKWIGQWPDDAAAYADLALILWLKGDRDGAAAAWRNGLKAVEEKVRRTGGEDLNTSRDLARLLTDCDDDRLRDPRRAVEAARKVLELAGTQVHYGDFVFLALALYRAGDYPAAAATAERAIASWDAPSPKAWLTIALSHARRGDREAARPWYERAARHLDENPPGYPSTVRLRHEAAKLLGIPVLPKGAPPPPPNH
jgi:Flp pilus assembly protein TadD